MAGQEVEGQFVALLHAAAPAALQEDAARVLVHAVVRLELADLERGAVAGGVASTAPKRIWASGISAVTADSRARQAFLQLRGTRCIEPVTSKKTATAMLLGVFLGVARASRTFTL